MWLSGRCLLPTCCPQTCDIIDMPSGLSSAAHRKESEKKKKRAFISCRFLITPAVIWSSPGRGSGPRRDPSANDRLRRRWLMENRHSGRDGNPGSLSRMLVLLLAPSAQRFSCSNHIRKQSHPRGDARGAVVVLIVS